LAAGVAALFVVSQTSITQAASNNRSTNVSYSSNSSQAMSSRAEEPVPANCVRQECGKLWCWQMKGSNSH
jgi:hypothetical protein